MCTSYVHVQHMPITIICCNYWSPITLLSSDILFLIIILFYVIIIQYSNTHRQNHRHDLVALALVKATYSRKDSRTMDACKQQNHGSMQAAELWKHASSRTEACKQQNYESMQAAEPWKHASSRTMKAFKQQNHGLEYM